MQIISVLILDDEKEICFLLSSLLNQMGYHTDKAHTLCEARKKFGKSDYDLFFLDLNLPDGLGYHLVNDIKENNSKAKIVMISAHDGMLNQLKKQVQGVDMYIYKPFNLHTISNALKELNLVFETKHN